MDDTGEAFVAESLSKWTPRFVANGIDINDMDRLRERIDAWEEWCPEFVAFADERAALGEEAEERGDLESAGEHFTHAAMYYHFGSHTWHVDEEVRLDAHAKAVETYLRGAEYRDPPLERIESPTDFGFSVPGNLRVPERGPGGGAGDSPLVILLPGSDSIKEELDWYGQSLIDRGLATLAIDGAGQGETHAHRGMSPDYHELVSPVIDHVRELDPEGVDTSRLGIYGVSLGGWYAPHTAANEERIDACAGISGKFTVGPASIWTTEFHAQHYQWACKTDSMIEVDEITEAMTLREDAPRLTVPTLALTGANDVITPPDQTRRIAERAPGGEFVCFEDGNHVCNNVTYKARPFVADWLREKLT